MRDPSTLSVGILMIILFNYYNHIAKRKIASHCDLFAKCDYSLFLVYMLECLIAFRSFTTIMFF